VLAKVKLNPVTVPKDGAIAGDKVNRREFVEFRFPNLGRALASIAAKCLYIALGSNICCLHGRTWVQSE
jgi:hypothetical protein